MPYQRQPPVELWEAIPCTQGWLADLQDYAMEPDPNIP